MWSYNIIILLSYEGVLVSKYIYIQATVLAVLDTMMQPLEGEPNTYIVYYQILDGDQHGRAPNCRTFDGSHKSCLHKISKSNNKVNIILLALCINLYLGGCLP